MHKSLTPENKEANLISTEYDVLDLSDILRAICNSWKLIISTTLLFAFIALILALTLSKQWEATATLHIGRVPSLSDLGESKLIEDPLQTAERIKLMGFKQKVLVDLGFPTQKGKDNRTDLLLNSLKGSAIQNTEFVSLSTHGYSENEAINTLKVVIKEIQAVHALITLPLKNRTLKESLVIATNLTNTSEEVTDLKNKMTNINKTDSAFAPSIVAINLLAAKEAEEHSFQNQQIQNNARLMAFDEQATALVNTIDVSTKPVFPKKSIFLAIGALLGLFIGTWIAILKYKKVLNGKIQ